MEERENAGYQHFLLFPLFFLSKSYTLGLFNQTTNFRLVQTETVRDDNFRFDENTRKLSKQVENTVGKGEIACYKQFLLFLQCFQKACFPGASKGVIVWEWVKPKIMWYRLKWYYCTSIETVSILMDESNTIVNAYTSCMLLQ